MPIEPDRLLLVAARELSDALEACGFVPTVIGGVAVSLITRSRHTDDVDVQIIFDTDDADQLIAALARYGFRPRFDGMDQLARQARLLTMIHESSGTIVDIALGCMPFELEVQSRAQLRRSAGFALRLPAPDDLVIMKAIAGRPKDLDDIRNIAVTYPDMDRERIKHWVTQYGELLETPDLWIRIEPLLAL